MIQHHDTSAECLSYTSNIFFSLDAFKLRTCWFSLLYLYFLLVSLNIFLLNHSMIQIGQPMHWWLFRRSVFFFVFLSLTCFCFNFTSILCLFYCLCTRRISFPWNCVWILEKKRAKYKRTCTTINIWLSIYSLSLWRSCVPFIQWYFDGKYVPFRVHLGEITTLALLTSTTYSNQFSIFG